MAATQSGRDPSEDRSAGLNAEVHTRSSQLLRQDVPFDVNIPNVATVEALSQAQEPDELTECSSLDELKATL
ncbi:hypothetical protein [Candidatus Poriferisodalis sp.]|uniref:hypothetical protein n=1 Tax=Candidatus Poriferisodalis sp. TaxID=3101277 RepID=UPI003B5ABDB0